MASPMPRYVQALNEIKHLTTGVGPGWQAVIPAVHQIATEALKRRIARPQCIKDLAGLRFGRLVALRIVGKARVGREMVWECRCDCGEH